MLILSNTREEYTWEFKFNGFNNDENEDAKCTKAYAILDIEDTIEQVKCRFVMAYGIEEDKIVSLVKTKTSSPELVYVKIMTSIVKLLEVELREYFKFAIKIK